MVRASIDNDIREQIIATNPTEVRTLLDNMSALFLEQQRHYHFIINTVDKEAMRRNMWIMPPIPPVFQQCQYPMNEAELCSIFKKKLE